MKFGQNLPRNQVPEWAHAYIDYKGLKRLIKTAQREKEAGQEPDLAAFLFMLDRQLENIDTFYNRKYGELSRRLRLLYNRYGMLSKMQGAMDKDEMDDLMATLLELRGQYRNLQWYGEVNRRGFIKITKKLDKKIPQAAAQSQYVSTKIDPKPFATNNKLALDLRSINDWLSNLGPIKEHQEDASSDTSSGSLRRMASKNAVTIPALKLEGIEKAIRQDDVVALFELLADVKFTTASQRECIYLDLLQRAITNRSLGCIEAFLSRVSSLQQDDDMNKRNCLHRIIIAIGRARALASEDEKYISAARHPVSAPPPINVAECDPDLSVGGKDLEAVKVLAFLLQHMTTEQRPAIASKDSHGRLPLHYAAQYGLVDVCQELIKYMRRWDLFSASEGTTNSAWWQESDGKLPLHLAIIGGHPKTTRVLLCIDEKTGHADIMQGGALLALATKSNFHVIVQMLVDAGVSVNYQDQSGDTALHIAARLGHEDCAKAILSAADVDVEIGEKTYGWTPLFIACVDGHMSIVKILVSHGARVLDKDQSGWTPKEHAALRGHIAIAEYLDTLGPDSPDASTDNNSLEDRTSKCVSKASNTPVKSFGHRYLTDSSLVLVSLGSMDPRKDHVPAVSFESIALNKAQSTQLDTALSIVVSAQNATGDATVIDLPVQENISTSPITFQTKDPSQVKLLFDVVHTYSGQTDKIVGRAVAILSSIKPSIGTKRMNLQGDLSVPVVASTTLDVIGTVNFNFLIITPFVHPNMSVSAERTYWKKSATHVIGHRGLGKNMPNRNSLQLGENTIDSFIAAASLGASYVEFDVQMTKDHVPVIYHDFLVSETGVDVPVHSLTLEQFLALSEHRSPPSRGQPNSEASPPTLPRRPQRSYSVDTPPSHATQDSVTSRLQLTRDFKKKGFKGNLRGHSIGSEFTTLKNLFVTLPEHISFNIEMKYPMLWESVDEEMDTYCIELNSFVDTILSTVYDYAATSNRQILFSSFNPDICLLLSFKQPNFPVLFLTDAGVTDAGDLRAASLQEAIRFASRWNLLGIVSAAKPLVIAPRLIEVVKQSGLICISYGVENNETGMVKEQVRRGIDAVIVDNVARVRRDLAGEDGGNEDGGVGVNGLDGG